MSRQKEMNAELEKKLTQHRTMLQVVKSKLTSQKEQIANLSAENDQLKKKAEGQEGKG